MLSLTSIRIKVETADTYHKEMKRNIMECYKQLCGNKLDTYDTKMR